MSSRKKKPERDICSLNIHLYTYMHIYTYCKRVNFINTCLKHVRSFWHNEDMCLKTIRTFWPECIPTLVCSYHNWKTSNKTSFHASYNIHVYWYHCRPAIYNDEIFLALRFRFGLRTGRDFNFDHYDSLSLSLSLSLSNRRN